MAHSRCKVISTITAFVLTASLILSGGCSRHRSGKSSDDTTETSTMTYYDYLGDISYDSSVSAMVYEAMEGEDEAGIQYRTVTDINGLIASGYTDILLYFYTSLSTDVYGVTAGTEDIAQVFNGKILTVAVNAMENPELVEAYGVTALPEYVLIGSGEAAKLFEGYNYEYWTMDDVLAWIESNGYIPDYGQI